jgi:formate hydrogenlyase transcriptional activator
LAGHFPAEFSRRLSNTIETIPSETMKALRQYRWPGNIREVQQVIQRAVTLSSGRHFRQFRHPSCAELAIA